MQKLLVNFIDCNRLLLLRREFEEIEMGEYAEGMAAMRNCCRIFIEQYEGKGHLESSFTTES
jgi:hypothetical protein